MPIHDFRSPVLLAVAVIYIGIIGWVSARRLVAGSAWPGLIGYAIVGAALSALTALGDGGQLAGWPAPDAR